MNNETAGWHGESPQFHCGEDVKGSVRAMDVIDNPEQVMLVLLLVLVMIGLIYLSGYLTRFPHFSCAF